MSMDPQMMAQLLSQQLGRGYQQPTGPGGGMADIAQKLALVAALKRGMPPPQVQPGQVLGSQAPQTLNTAMPTIGASNA